MPKARNAAAATLATLMLALLAEAGVADELGDKLDQVTSCVPASTLASMKWINAARPCLPSTKNQRSRPESTTNGRTSRDRDGLQHPQKIVDCVQRALSLPLDPFDCLQLRIYWGAVLEVAHRGVHGDDLKRARAEIVVIYLQGITECRKRIAEVEAKPLRETALTTLSYAEGLKKKDLEHFQRFLNVFEGQIAFLVLPPTVCDR